MTDVTVIIMPRDRYSGIIECIKTLYQYTEEPFNLWVLEMGYPRHLVRAIKAELSKHQQAHLMPLGRVIPMEALRKVRDQIETPYTFCLDNDSRVTQGWLSPLLAAARQGASIVTPLTLEREGVDKGAPLRNHIYTSEVRIVDVNSEPYLIEYKPLRRELPENIPKDVVRSDLFELHGVLFNTKALQNLELPQMVIREHIDIGLQLQAKGEFLLAQPHSIIQFDNLGNRMKWYDIEYFNFRWSPKLLKYSNNLFEERWGYRFYSEKYMFNWVFRRRLFLIARFFGCPIFLANKLGGLARRLFLKDWDPLEDPIQASKRFYETLADNKPKQKNNIIFCK